MSNYRRLKRRGLFNARPAPAAPAGPTAEVTTVQFNSTAGGFERLQVTVPAYSGGQTQIVAIENYDTTTLNGGYINVDSGMGVIGFWFNAGREHLYPSIDLTGAFYGFFDILGTGNKDIYIFSPGGGYQVFGNDGFGNFTDMGAYDLGTNFIDGYVADDGMNVGVEYFYFTTDGSDQWSALSNNDGTFQAPTLLAPSGWIPNFYGSNIHSADVDGDSIPDTITLDSFRVVLSLSAYGGAVATNPASGDYNYEVGYRNTDDPATVADRLQYIANLSSYFTAFAGTPVAYLQNLITGACAAPYNGAGTSMDPQVIQAGSGANINPGDFFLVNVPFIAGTSLSTTNIACYFVINGYGNAPLVADLEIALEIDTADAAIACQCALSINNQMVDSRMAATQDDPADSYFYLTPGAIGPTTQVIYVTDPTFEIQTLQGGADQPYPGYITFNTPTTLYGVWFEVSGMNTAPTLPGRTIVKVTLTQADTTPTIATAFKTAMNAVASKTYTVTDFSGNSNKKTVTNNAAGAVTDAAKTISGLSVTVSTQGS